MEGEGGFLFFVSVSLEQHCFLYHSCRVTFFFCIGKRKKTTATLAAGAQCCLFKKNHKCVAANSPLTYALPISELATLRVNPSWVVERVETRVHH